MHKNRRRSTLLLLATAALLSSPALAAAPVAMNPLGQGDVTPATQAPAVETRLHAVRYISLPSAYTLAKSVCGEIPRELRGVTECGVAFTEQSEQKGYILLTTTPAIQEHFAALLARVDQPPLTQSFHIVVLAASEEEAPSATLPGGAQQALEDIKELLPFRSFRVLDSGWLKTSSQAATTLSGPTGFEVELAFRPVPDSQGELLIEGFELTQRIEPVHSPTGEAQGPSHRRILSTTLG
ncbi:MAG: hypothetical protein ACE5HV_08075, partial [Acidobacteriota bacterium]